MTRNLKALGLALLTICALGAVAAQGASAHEFHAGYERVILTGKNIGTVKFQVGAAGTVECTKAELEGTQTGTLVSAGTYQADTITVAPRFTGCTFGGQAATVNFNHCAVVVDSETSGGNPDGGEHADVEMECAEGTQIEIHTAVCTITGGAGVGSDAVRFENDTASSIKVKATAKGLTTGKVRNTAAQPANGCLTFPSGAVGTATGELTVECFKDEGSALFSTEATTPQGKTSEGAAANCAVA